MKKTIVITLIVSTALLSGCGKTPAEAAVTENEKIIEEATPTPTPAPAPTPVTPTNVLSGETCTFKTNKEAMEYGNANVSSIMKKYNKKSVYYTVTYGGPNKFIVQFFG